MRRIHLSTQGGVGTRRGPRRSRAAFERLENRVLLNGTDEPGPGASRIVEVVGPLTGDAEGETAFKVLALMGLTATPDGLAAAGGRALPVGVRVDLKGPVASLLVSLQGTGVFAGVAREQTLAGPWDSDRPAGFVLSAAPTGAGEGALTIVARALDGSGAVLSSSRRDVFAWYEGARTWVSGSSPTDLKLGRLETLFAESAIGAAAYAAGIDAVVGSVGLGGDGAGAGTIAASTTAAGPHLDLAAVDVEVSGQAQWKDSADKLHGIPSATLEVYERRGGADTLLKSGTTDSQGKFKLTVTPTGAAGKADLFVRVLASSTIADVKPMGAAAKTYFVDSPVKAGVVLGAPTTINVTTATRTADSDTAFSVHSAVVLIGGHAGTVAGSAPSKVTVRFPTTEAISLFKSSAKELHILRQDRWDWDVIHHEYGHYVANVNKVTDLIGGGHGFEDNLTVRHADKSKGIRLAWGEGWPTFFAISGQAAASASALGIPNVGDTSFDDTEDVTLNQDLETSTGKGEDNEASVFATLWDLYDANKDGDDRLSISAKTLFGLFKGGKANTAGTAWEAIAAPRDDKEKTEVGAVFGMDNIAPVPTAPADKTRLTKAKDVVEFKWKKNGGGAPNPLNEFRLRFYSDDLKTLLLETKDLGDVDKYTPTADEWKTITTGRSSFKWVVLGKNKKAPATPGGALGFYWSKPFAVSGTTIAFVIDDTGSMGEEIAGVQAALQKYIAEVESKLKPGDRPPMMELITFKDDVTIRLVSDDLAAVKAAVADLAADGGGDCPEFSSQALAVAADEIAPGGTILLATDASSKPGVDKAALIAQLKARGVTVNTILSGDCGPIGPVGFAALATAHVCDDEQAEPAGPAVVGGTVGVTATAGAPSKPGVDGDDEDDLEVPIDDPGQPPLDLFGDTPESAAPLSLGAEPVQGALGAPFNFADMFAVSLTASVRHAIQVLVDVGFGVHLQVFGPDGATELLSRFLLPNEEVPFTPGADGTYHIKVSPLFSGGEQDYRLSVRVDPLAGVTSAVELYSTISAETGGAFLVRDGVNAGDPEPFEAAIFNVMMSTLGPVVLSSNPAIVPQGQTMSVSLTGRGTNWRAGQSTVAFPGAGVDVLSVEVHSATSLTALVRIDLGATIGLRDVAVSTPLGSTTEIAQGSRVLQVSGPVTGPTLLSVVPNTLIQGGTYDLLIRGANTTWGPTSVLTLGSDVVVNSATVESPNTIRANVTVRAAADIGFRLAQVATGTSTDTLDRALFVGSGAAIVPELIGLSPNAARRGQEIDVAVTGASTHFVAGVTTASFGDGVAVQSVTVTSPTAAVVRILVAADAPLGFHTPLLTTGSETAVLLNGFFIDQSEFPPPPPPESQPRLVRVDPASASQGQRIAVVVSGTDTHFLAGQTLAWFADGISILTVTVTSPTTATVVLLVSPDARLGPHDVTMTTGAEHVGLVGAFTVAPGDTTGPVVARVRRIGVHHAPTRILITFDEALDPARAHDARNYELFQVAAHDRLRPIGIRLAQYDPATRTTTLWPAERLYLHGSYRLRIDGTSPAGITDLVGNLLDGDRDLRPGGDFLGTLLGPGLVTTPPPLPPPPPPIHVGPVYPRPPCIHKVVKFPIVGHRNPWIVARPIVPRLGGTGHVAFPAGGRAWLPGHARLLVGKPAPSQVLHWRL